MFSIFTKNYKRQENNNTILFYSNKLVSRFLSCLIFKRFDNRHKKGLLNTKFEFKSKSFKMDG